MQLDEITFLKEMLMDCQEALKPDNAVDSIELTMRNLVPKLRERIVDCIRTEEYFMGELTSNV